MLRTTLLASMAAILATLGTSAMACAHEHHQYYNNAYASDNGLIVDGNESENDDEDDADVVSVSEPVYYAPEQTSYVATQTTYVPVNDTIVTPYGYHPVYNNGYYQGYGYNPQYAYNPYYAGAAYGQGDPVSAAVVNTVLSAASNNGHVDGRTLIQSLVGGYLAAQAQQQYQQPVYQQPVYQQVYQQAQQPVYYPQPTRVIRVFQQQAPAYEIRHGNHGEERGDREHGDGDHGDHGGND